MSGTTQAVQEAVLALRHVGKRFEVDGRPLQVLHDLNLEVAEGEFTVIVGASGCGKSTLLRLLAGLDAAYDGEISVDGRAVRDVGRERGIIFQEHRLFPWLTVADNVALGLAAEAPPAAQVHERVAAMIALVGLQGFERALPHQLSGGMAQRVALARGLIADPRILLLDEPFGALDALTRHQMQDELLAIRERRRTTMLLVTHDVEEAIVLADRIVVLAPRPGRIRRIIDVDLPHPRRRGSYRFHSAREALMEELLLDENAAGEPRRKAAEEIPLQHLQYLW
nr:ABC transporter ATP-binding protein [Solimonas soli]